VAFEYRDVRRRHDDHHRIYEAIVAQEPWRAEMLMREHVSSIKTSLIRSLAERHADHPGEMRPADESVT
jgi:GntR family transcriptional regulator of vanillate catabolism